MDKIIRKKINLLLLGDHKVGKTSIINSYLNIEFDENVLSTIGLEKFNKNFEFESSLIGERRTFRLNIFDVSGQEKYRSLSSSSLRISDGIILIYSINDRKSFENIENVWMEKIKDSIDIKSKQIILVSNKIDLFIEGDITKEEGQNLSKKLNIPFFECSAKENLNINEFFDFISKNIAVEIFQKENENKNDNKIILKKEKRKRGNYIKQGCFPSPIIAFANIGQACADAMAEEREKKKKRKCLIE